MVATVTFPCTEEFKNVIACPKPAGRERTQYYMLLSLYVPSVIPRPYQPQWGSLSVLYVGRRVRVRTLTSFPHMQY